MNTLTPSRTPTEITRSRRIGFLIYPDCEVLDVCGPFDAFHYANRWLLRFGRTGEPGYLCDLIAATPGPVRTSCGIELGAARLKLEQTVLPVETIAEECGFGNSERMRTFQRLFDVSPHDYRARFRSTLLN
jgi:transcriptional regulator GlxA family with amidase domain